MKRTLLVACTLAVLSAVRPGPVLAASACGASSVLEALSSNSGEGCAFSELRIGFLLHDRAFFHERKEKGHDVNLEFLFASPRRKLFKAVRSPRPHVGVSINDEGDTSQLYGGFTWEWRPFGNAFLDASLGLSLHDGDLKPGRRNLEGLGLRVLFRVSAEAGYRIHGRHGVSFLIDHISNADLAAENDGITSVGLRYGYRF